MEDHVLFNENIMYDKKIIKDYVKNFIIENLNKQSEKERPFVFEEIIYSFFEYMKIDIIKTKKTRDFGIDGIVKLKLDLLGEINLGIQIKYKTIDSNDIDLFLSALRNAELQIGVIIPKETRRLDKYQLDTKIKAILLSKGIKIKEKIIKEDININPVFILKLEEIIDIATDNMRNLVSMIYKK